LIHLIYFRLAFVAVFGNEERGTEPVEVNWRFDRLNGQGMGNGI